VILLLFEIELALYKILVVVIGVSLSAALVDRLGQFSVRMGVRRDIFYRWPGHLGALYCRQEIRKGSFWFGILASAALAVFVHSFHPILSVIAFLFNVLRSTWSLAPWRGLTIQRKPETGQVEVFQGFSASQILQFLISFLVFLLFAEGDVSAVFVGSIGGIVAASSVIWEGDAGRPGLVVVLSLTVGGFLGIFSFAYPVTLLASLYLWSSMKNRYSYGAYRIQSLEFFDEDRLI